jgi:probable HAF family extracellular repeat protein
MTLSQCFKVRHFILAAALTINPGFLNHAKAQGGPVLVDLNTRAVTPLGTLGGYWEQPYDINDSGQVVGWSGDSLEDKRAFITGPNGVGMRDLGTLGGNWSEAYSINDAGQVVGFSYAAAEGPPHAFITGPDGMGMRDLGTLGGIQSWAVGINDAGQVVGWSETAGGDRHAFITGPDGIGMRDLGTLGGGGGWDYSYAYGINDAGQGVGYSRTEGYYNHHAFITSPDGEGMTDLNSLVDLPQGWVIAEAWGINNNGQIIAAVPEPQIYGLLLAGLGLIGFIARRKSTENG